MKNKTIWWILGIAAVVGLGYFVYTKYLKPEQATGPASSTPVQPSASAGAAA